MSTVVLPASAGLWPELIDVLAALTEILLGTCATVTLMASVTSSAPLSPVSRVCLMKTMPLPESSSILIATVTPLLSRSASQSFLAPVAPASQMIVWPSSVASECVNDAAA